MNKTQGFTLIELMLVMAIIGILAVVGLGSYTQAVIKSRDTQRKSDLNQIARAIELYNNDVGRYPIDNDDGIDPIDNDDGKMRCNEVDLCEPSIYAVLNGATATYMDKVPIDETAGQVYYYKSDGGSFALYAALVNSKDRDVVEDADGNKTNWDSDLVTCGTGISCNYKLTETGLIRTK